MGCRPGESGAEPTFEDYLLVFPESDPGLGQEWVHFQAGDSKFPTLDLEFVAELLADLVAGG